MIILLTVVFYFTVEAQQKNVTHRTKFSGEWKTKEPISIGGNIFCSYLEGDRMNSKTMESSYGLLWEKTQMGNGPYQRIKTQ